MEQQPQTQKLNKKPSRSFIIAIVIIIVIVLGWAGLTKAGFLENYLDIEFLCSENYDFFSNNETPYYLNLRPAAKPVIYLYPEHKQKVDVKINYSGNLTVSYPKYNNGWQVIAYPDGKVINLSDNREYSYLFWEGVDKNANYNLSSGFIVPGSETVKFLQDKLAKLGLMPKEYNEFIVYWLPQMQDNEYNLIHFATKEEYNGRAILEITPKPDSLLRVFMVFKKIYSPTEINPQEIKPFERNGFVVVEWGGTEIK